VAISDVIGQCDYCESKNTVIVNCEALSGPFEQLFEMYVNHPNAEKSLKHKNPVLLHEHLREYWKKLFNNALLKEKDVKQLVNQIGQGSDLFSNQLFEQPVELSILVDTQDAPAEDLELKWDKFSQEIKRTNRFFIREMIDTETLNSVLARLVIAYPAETLFYRARISDTPLAMAQLGKPPYEQATPGRANPVGIPYLYVSESEETTLYETRVALHEGISIGKFRLMEPLNVVSLKNIADFGPFEIIDRGFVTEGFIRFRPYLQKLENELSRPVRKQDVHLDYLPTQFLCEYIKSEGFDAVEYKSAMNATGYNLAIFNDNKLTLESSIHYKVNNLKYNWGLYPPQ
jgi:hypothetical protein